MLLDNYTADGENGGDYSDIIMVHLFEISSQLVSSYEKTFFIAVGKVRSS